MAAAPWPLPSGLPSFLHLPLVGVEVGGPWVEVEEHHPLNLVGEVLVVGQGVMGPQMGQGYPSVTSCHYYLHCTSHTSRTSLPVPTSKGCVPAATVAVPAVLAVVVVVAVLAAVAVVAVGLHTAVPAALEDSCGPA